MTDEIDLLKLPMQRLREMDDTSPDMAQKVCEMLEKKSPFERLRMGFSMYRTCKCLVTRSILESSPQISQEDLRKELFLKFYGNDFDSDQREKILRYLAEHRVN